jgi:aquaporin Z
MVYYFYSFIISHKEGNYMATSKSGSKASTAKKSTTKKKTTTASTTKVTTKTAAAAKLPVFKKQSGEPNYPAIIIAEVIGTFILTLVALLTLQGMAALYVGITLAVLVLAVGAVSGAHLNPAVSFGLWSARKLKTPLLPVYWVAQFVGAILAILMLGAFNGSGYPLDFSHCSTIHWGVLFAELLGTAVFLFGLMAAISNEKLSQTGKAFGVGLALTIGILVSGSAFASLQSGVDTSKVDVSDASTIPRVYSVKGATLNPAVALATTENTPSQLSGYPAAGEEAQHSRLGLEVILGTLIGAAIGANLYLLVAYAQRQQD